ncbi:MAG: hypothetical protein AAFY56_05280, partial [Pseudomonadota bacterium]
MRRRVSIRSFLTIVLGILTLVPMLVVLAVTLMTAGKNTTDLLRDKARLIQADLVNTATQYLRPAEEIPIFMEEMIAAGSVDGDDAENISKSLLFALAGAPQVQSVAYLHRDGWMVTVFHDAATGEL